MEKLLSIEKRVSEEGHRVYVVYGALFFVSVEQFVTAFDFREEADAVEIDFTHAHVCDASAVSAIDRVVLKLREGGPIVHTSGLNTLSSALLDRLALHDQPGATLSHGHG